MGTSENGNIWKDEEGLGHAGPLSLPGTRSSTPLIPKEAVFLSRIKFTDPAFTVAHLINRI